MNQVDLKHAHNRASSAVFLRYLLPIDSGQLDRLIVDAGRKLTRKA